MKPKHAGQAAGGQGNIISLPREKRLGRIPKPENTQPGQQRARFRVLEFRNASGSTSWRVQGMTREGRYVRQNFADLQAAQCRRTELEADFQKRRPEDPSVRMTTLSEPQLRLAETAFTQLGKDADLLEAVHWWLKGGRQVQRNAAPRLDEAVAAFMEWLTLAESLRPRTKLNLQGRIAMFANGVPNLPVDQFTPEAVERFLAGRRVAPETRINDRKAISRFFGWCAERPRRWVSGNPAAEVPLQRPERPPPAILTVDECAALLRSAQAHKGGKMMPYVTLSLFAGLRPWEISRLTWAQIFLADGQIRLDGIQTKTGRPRVIDFGDGPREQGPFNRALRTWLSACEGRPIFPPSALKDFAAIRRAAGFGRGLKPWAPDVMRHTAVSAYVRLVGSYAEAANLFGNSEQIIRTHYFARMTTAAVAEFYALRPAKGGSR